MKIIYDLGGRIHCAAINSSGFTRFYASHHNSWRTWEDEKAVLESTDLRRYWLRGHQWNEYFSTTQFMISISLKKCLDNVTDPENLITMFWMKNMIQKIFMYLQGIPCIRTHSSRFNPRKENVSQDMPEIDLLNPSISKDIINETRLTLYSRS